mgnify:CR=1 FL=1
MNVREKLTRFRPNRFGQKDNVEMKIVFVNDNGVRQEVEASVGASVLDVAHRNGFDLEGACEGSMACCTCHVIVDKAWFGKLSEASEEEEGVLDLDSRVAPTSRLGCQITLTKDLDGLVVSLPEYL